MIGATHRVFFAPSSKEVSAAAGQTVLEAAREAAVYVDAQCGGKGTCGRCRVRVMEGSAGPLTEQEAALVGEDDAAAGYRLACMARVGSDLAVLVPEERVVGSASAKGVFAEAMAAPEPAVKAFEVDLAGPDADPDVFGRMSSLLAARHGLRDLAVDLSVLQDLGRAGATTGGAMSVLVRDGREIIAARPAGAVRLGLAVDIGTTTVAAYACDLSTGRLVASGAATNPQVLFGADVVSRISYSATHPGGVKRMQQTVVDAINALVGEMAKSSGFAPGDVVDATVVGNTVMHHIFLGVPPDRLGLSPFTPVVRRSLDVKARDLGLRIGRGAYVHVLPVQAGFVGADNVAVLISEEPQAGDEITLVMDIGTNGEIVLGNREGLLSCSCATGPALEGAQISCGMRATKGAIERVRIDPATFEAEYGVIGAEGREDGGDALQPAGLCGSAIVDVVAQLYVTGLIGKDGAFSRDRRTARLRKGESGVAEFVVAWKEESATGRDIVFTQKDVRQVQLAKAALHAGCGLLMERLGICSVSRMVVAGAFGMHLDKRNALAIGLFPACEPEKIAMVGNAAGRGACLALLDVKKRAEADGIATWVTHVELAREEGFQRAFVEGLAMP